MELFPLCRGSMNGLVVVLGSIEREFPLSHRILDITPPNIEADSFDFRLESSQPNNRIQNNKKGALDKSCWVNIKLTL